MGLLRRSLAAGQFLLTKGDTKIHGINGGSNPSWIGHVIESPCGVTKWLMLYRSEYRVFSDAHNALAMLALRRAGDEPVTTAVVNSLYIELLTQDDEWNPMDCWRGGPRHGLSRSWVSAFR
jgi:hypothetical protein